MTDNGLIWLREDEIVDLVDLNDAIDALESGLSEEGAGAAKNIPKALGTWGDGSSMHALGSVFTESGYCGWKAWSNTKRAADALFILFDSDNGGLKAIMEAVALGMMRTSAISGLATRWLAKEDATEMALVGTGKQALTQVAAVAAVRPLERLKVYSPTPESRARFVEEASSVFDFAVEPAESVESCVAGMPIVTLVTRASEPFLTADMLAAGSHVNAVGAILPGRREFTQDVFARADLVVGDYLENLQRASQEFIDYFEEGPGDWAQVKLLSKVIAEGRKRPANADVTLFKAMGMGISDLSVAKLAYERACERGLGTPVKKPGRAKPRWRALEKV